MRGHVDLLRGVPKGPPQTWKAVMDAGHEGVIMLCDSRLRSSLAEMLSRTVPLMPVVAYDEIVLGTEGYSLPTGSVPV